MITYQLTPKEMELAQAGRLEEIPTAADRGLIDTEEPAEPADKRNKVKINYDPFNSKMRPPRIPKKHPQITAEYLKEERAKGRLYMEIAAEHGIALGTMYSIVRRYKLAKERLAK